MSNWSSGLIKLTDDPTDRKKYSFYEHDHGHGTDEIYDFDMREFYPSIIKTITKNKRDRELLDVLSTWRKRLDGDAAKFMKRMLVSFFGSLKHTDYLMYLAVIDVSNRCMSDCVDFFERGGHRVLLVMKDGMLVRRSYVCSHTESMADFATAAVKDGLKKTMPMDYGINGDSACIQLQLRGTYDRLILLNTNAYMLVNTQTGETKSKGISSVKHSGFTKRILDCVTSYVSTTDSNVQCRRSTVDSIKCIIDNIRAGDLDDGYTKVRVSPWLELSFLNAIRKPTRSRHLPD